MTSTLSRSGVFRLPRIRTKDELLKTSPEIAALFGDAAADETFAISAGRETSPHRATLHRTNKPLDSPRVYDDEASDDDVAFVDLEEVKKERQLLMRSIAHFKTSIVVAGGEAQENDIKQLMKELQLKKHKLNEMRQDGDKKERELARLCSTSADCEKLMLSNEKYLLQYIDHLNEEMRSVQDDLIEVEAKNRLYTLLGERTRREHMASEQRVRQSRELRKNLRDDIGTISRAFHESCCLKEETERQVAKLKRMYREIQKDWQRKLKDRRKEVRQIRRAQLREREKEERRTRRRQEREEAEAELGVQKEREKRAMEEKVNALAPKIQGMEATWYRICSAARASSGDEIIAFWKGLKEKEAAMRALVEVKEAEERAAQVELQTLEKRRARRLEATEETATDRGDEEVETAAEIRSTTPSATPQRRESFALSVRVEQGLKSLLRELSPRRELTNGVDLSLDALFAEFCAELTRLRDAASVDGLEPSSCRPVGRTLMTKRRLRSLSHRFQKGVDVTKLFGYIDVDQDTVNCKRRVGSSDEVVGEDELVERSFLKARSLRFTKRQQKQREVAASKIGKVHQRWNGSPAGARRAVGSVVVVESPAKATKIQEYLGDAYQVLSSFGHVCDISKKKGAIDVENGFAVQWETIEKGEAKLEEISQALKDAGHLILATDPDREGEGISWHVFKELQSLGCLDGKSVERISFNQISSDAVFDALANPRPIDQGLVDAYLARRVIDHLLGFSLSPVLWRKLPGARSAGRVQSPCLKLMCEREEEILKFKSEDYWSVDAVLKTGKATVCASLTRVNGQALKQRSLSTPEKAEMAVAAVQEAELFVKSIEDKSKSEKPLPPYRTSTLQQDAASRLKWNAARTMRVAQTLYDGRNNTGHSRVPTLTQGCCLGNGAGDGLITYMRTDAVSISLGKVQEIRAVVAKQFGQDFLPKKRRTFASAAKNAQEAHEAIHPVHIHLQPEDLAKTLTADERKLYRLIWERTVASQMSNAEYTQRTAVFADMDDRIRLRGTGRKENFKGYTVVYKPLSEETTSNRQNSKNLEQFQSLGQLHQRDAVESATASKHAHATKPPPRYTESSIIRSMEALGIGRPSTFSSITAILVDRRYVKRNRHTFYPQPLGRVLSVYLENHFETFMDYEFTAMMENRLDDIAAGKANWKSVCQEFWDILDPSVQQAMKVGATETIKYINARVLESVFLPLVTEEKPLEKLQKCPLCGKGNLLIKMSKFGPFIGCDQYNTEKCSYRSSMTAFGKDKAITQ